jgi:hypothetical protein
MADITLSPTFDATIRIRRPVWLDRVAHHAEILRRRARRNRYLALTGRSSRSYPWFETMVAGMSGR